MLRSWGAWQELWYQPSVPNLSQGNNNTCSLINLFFFLEYIVSCLA